MDQQLVETLNAPEKAERLEALRRLMAQRS